MHLLPCLLPTGLAKHTERSHVSRENSSLPYSFVFSTGATYFPYPGCTCLRLIGIWSTHLMHILTHQPSALHRLASVKSHASINATTLGTDFSNNSSTSSRNHLKLRGGKRRVLKLGDGVCGDGIDDYRETEKGAQASECGSKWCGV